MNNLLLFMSITGTIPMIFYYIVRKIWKEKVSAHAYKLLLLVSMFFFLVPTPLFSYKLQHLVDTYLLQDFFANRSFAVSPSKTIMIVQDDIQLPQYSTLFYSLASIWIIGAVAFISFHLVTYLRHRRKWMKSTALIETLHPKWMCWRPIQVRTTPSLSDTFSIGFLFPVIFLESTPSSEETELIYQHELYHIRNGDCALRFLGLIVIGLHWINPFSYLLLRELGIQGEFSADESTMKKLTPIKQHAYGRLIVNSICNQPLTMAENYVSRFKGHHFPLLRERILRLKNMKKQSKRKKSMIFIAIISTLLLNSLPVLAYQPPVPLSIDGNYDTSEPLDGTFIPESMKNQEPDFSLSDIYFIDEDHNSIPVTPEQLSEIQVQRACNHSWIAGRIEKHTKNSNGGCTTVIYQAKRCSKCGSTILGDILGTTTLKKCPH